jgi:hypothetical protein
MTYRKILVGMALALCRDVTMLDRVDMAAHAVR